ncbi:MAG: toprim domain-containing protein [Steroidobacteraceae bacterium]
MMNYGKFIAWAAEHGVLIDPARCFADGAIHRADAGERESDREDAAYLLWPDGDGWICNFKAGGELRYYRSREQGAAVRPITASEREEIRRRQAERAAEREAEHRCAVESARADWSRGRPADEHPYLRDPPLCGAGLRVAAARAELLVPVLGFDESDVLTWRGLQRIAADGTKKFALGTRSHGAFAMVPCGDDPLIGAEALRSAGRLILCEGIGTALALHQVTGLPAVAALSAGNLPVLARSLAGKVTDHVVVYADADGLAVRKEQSLIGQRMAVEAARVFGPHARVAIPSRRVGVTPPGYDARDQLRDGDGAAISAGIEEARPPDLIRVPSLAGRAGRAGRAPDVGDRESEEEREECELDR